VNAKLVEVGDIHPLNPHKLGEPFSSLVLNVNVSTRVHRDGKDASGCLVLPAGTFQGGELGLVEPRLVFQLQTSNLFYFHSDEVTHFNFHYEGMRISLVLHSDRSGVGYREDLNGWDRHIY
jgi:hypothetical protein